MEDNNHICPELQALLQYKDINPEELPEGLPSLRNIQHQIDFIPRSKLPNLPLYRMNPKEYQELQSIVEDLVQKDPIQESINPYVVPTLLVPKKDGTYKMCKQSGYQQDNH